MTTAMDREIRKFLLSSPEGRVFLQEQEEKQREDKRKAKRERARRVGPKRRAGVEKKRATKEERRAKVAAVREAVFCRAIDRRRTGLGTAACEFCEFQSATELHHLISGGARRLDERPETCAAVCTTCHREYHHCRLATLRAAKVWALMHGYRDALRAIEKRIAKVHEAHPKEATQP
jgi:hypothetical protein